MLCEKCKAREATIAFAEMANGIRKEHYYCSHCAAESDILQSIEVELPLAQLLSGILGMASTETAEDEFEGIVCPTCHRSYSEFVNDSRFGCEDCYHVFGPLIAPNIHKLQDSDVHVGKKPKYHWEQMDFSETLEPASETPLEQLQLLKLKLQEALAAEDYEQAVVYRDKIRALKEENHIDE